MIRRSAFALMIAVALGVLTACGLLAPEATFTSRHQPLPEGRPQCTTCHEQEVHAGSGKTYQAFDHTADFAVNHKVVALQDANTCAACHAPSFCSDCHAGKGIVAPAVKLGNRPDRRTPHKAGYLSLHQIDGKIDPTGCFKCHGRANNGSCRACHR